MIRHLLITNYGLIEKIELNLDKGLTAITGETGSGKSILLGAFSMLLGERADSKAIKNPELKCVVEGTFNLKGYSLKSFFQKEDLDYDDITTIRREIAPGGKSRSFINDTPVSLSTLKSIGEKLVDIHSQHENSILGARDFQFNIVDAFAQNESHLATYAEKFSFYKKKKNLLDELKHNEVKMKQDLDYFQFQLEELSKASLEEIHQESLEQELETLTHAETIKTALNQIIDLVQNDDSNAINVLSTAKNSLSKLSSYNKQLEEFAQRLETSIIELKELNREIESFEEDVSLDPGRVEIVQEKLNQLYHLQQKHRITDVQSLIDLREEIALKVCNYSSIDEQIISLENEITFLKSELNTLCDELSASRHLASKKVAEEVKGYFRDLSLDHAELNVEITHSEDFNAFGKNDIQFLFQANKGGQLLPIQKVASGGEISRVMLAIKASLSRHQKLPILILDEIDQGVSGEVGKKIGLILKQMSKEMQLITITHLPQIAGFATQHLKVSKTTLEHTTTTMVSSLTQDQRLAEIAEMLSGKDITKAALANARELLQSN
jgi:DNA repair protein RecN (Recombination protein N)